MKVIFVIVSMAGGGAERVISILANQFVKSGIDVCIMMTAGNEVSYELDERVQLCSMGGTSGGSLKKRIRRIRNMRSVFKGNRNSTIISFGPGTSFFTVVADLFLHHHLIISERNDPAACAYPIIRNLIYSKARAVVFQTEAAKNCFPVRIQKKGVVIANPISANLPDISRGERQKTVVAVGRLETQKNYPLLLDAFSEFHKQNKDFILHIYGEGSQKGILQEQAERLHIENYIVWEGFCRDVLQRIKRAGIYVLPSDYEGVSNALLEAMAMELPVVATDCPIGGSALCIEDGINGRLVPVRNVSRMVQAMSELVNDPEKAEKMAKEAGKVRVRFSEEKIAEQWKKLLL